jgi:hypothetical protein
MAAAVALAMVWTTTATAQPRPTGEWPGEGAVDAAVRCYCQGDNDCDDANRARIREVVADLIWATDTAVVEVPEEMRPFLVAVACGEGGFNPHPTCGADRECVLDCAGGEDDASEWQRCIRACGGRADCNDRGTSVGMLQFKADGRLVQGHLPVGTDLLDYVAMGRFYLQRLDVGVRELVPKACSTRRWPDWKVWDVAAYRLGRGPVAVPARPAQQVCYGDPHSQATACRTLQATDAVPRCNPGSKYARWARKWSKEAPGAWRLSIREASGK